MPCNQLRVTTGAAQIQGSTTDADSVRHWSEVRHASDLQFAPITLPKQPPPPAWLEAVMRFLKSLFDPVGRALGVSWPVMQWVLVGIAVALALLIAWRFVGERLLARRKSEAAPEPEWAPDPHAARALLEDADRLAGESRFDEAAHLLLTRSVQHIADARPDWVRRATTARELSALDALPDGARRAFAAIAARVERSRYALRALDAADWRAAREAYAAFALERIAA